VQIPQREGAIFGVIRAIQKHWQSLVQLSLQHHCKSDHSITNNVMQQKGSFSIPGKCKQESRKSGAQAMPPISQEATTWSGVHSVGKV